MLGTMSDEVTLRYSALDPTEDVTLEYYVRVGMASDSSLTFFFSRL